MSAVAAWTDEERSDFIAAAKAAIKGPRAEDAACAPAAPLSPRRGGRLNAGMGLTSILAALSRVGWGPLRGREFAASRAVLDTLALLAHDTKSDLSAVIQTTARSSRSGQATPSSTLRGACSGSKMLVSSNGTGVASAPARRRPASSKSSSAPWLTGCFRSARHRTPKTVPVTLRRARACSSTAFAETISAPPRSLIPMWT